MLVVCSFKSWLFDIRGSLSTYRSLFLFLGENPDRVYGQTRMDGQWNFRHAYDEARKIRDKQNAFCAKVDANDWAGLQDVNEGGEFPEDLQWESLVDVLRGRVKVCLTYVSGFTSPNDPKLAIHCYEVW